jgi:hypothetical protein
MRRRAFIAGLGSTAAWPVVARAPSRDSDGNQHLLDPVQLVQLSLQRSDARRSLAHRQRIVGHALDLGHHEVEHAVREQRGDQCQRITSVLGDVRGRRLSAGPNDAQALAGTDASHLRRKPSQVTPHARLDVGRRRRGAPEGFEFGIGRTDALADASEIMPIAGDRYRLQLRTCGQAIKPCLAGGQNRLLGLQPLLQHLLIGQEPFQFRLEGAGIVVGATDIAPQPRAPVFDAVLDSIGSRFEGRDRLVESEQLGENELG